MIDQNANQAPGSAQAGSQGTGPAINPNELGGAAAGQPAGGNNAGNTATQQVTEAMYKELEQRFGTQGNELGEYRTFFQNITPLLDKLNDAPLLVQAIVDGTLNEDILKKIESGEVKPAAAEAVAKANEQVKEDLGAKAYKAASPEEIEKLITEKVNAVRSELEGKAALDAFEAKTQKFIENTSDFAEYAEGIEEWLDSHDVTDIEVAYWAVKGKMSEEKARKTAVENGGEIAKEVASNAGGGNSSATATAEHRALVDSLIAGRSNPNVF